MALPSYPAINGDRFEFASIEVVLVTPSGTKKYLGIKSLNYSDSLEPGKMHGTSAQKLGRTRGTYDAEGSIEFYKEEFADFLAAIQPQGYMEVEFQAIATFAEPSAGQIQVDVCAGCRIKKVDDSHTEGSDPLTVKCDLDIMYVTRNGAAPLTTMKQ